MHLAALAIFVPLLGTAPTEELRLIIAASTAPLTKEQAGIPGFRTIDETKRLAAEAKAVVFDYAELGAVVAWGDPMGVEARKARLSALDEWLQKDIEGDGLIRIESFSAAARSFLRNLASELGERHPPFSECTDLDKVVVTLDSGQNVTLEAGGRRVVVPLFHPTLGKQPTAADELPFTSGNPIPNEPTTLPPSAPKELLFTAHGSATAIAGKARLMQAYLAEVEEEAEKLSQQWDVLLDSVFGRANGLSLSPGSRYVDLREEQRAALVESLRRSGVPDAEAFLRSAEVIQTHRFVSAHFRARTRDGRITGGSLPITR